MTKEHAKLIEKNANERKLDLSRLISYPEYYILKEELEKMIDQMNKIDNIDLESKVDVSSQVIGNRLARDKVVRFLSDMGVYSVKSQDTVDKTYA